MNDIEYLRRLKKTHGLSYREMAFLMKVPLRTLFRWLHKECEPSPMGQRLISAFIKEINSSDTIQ
jgi:transcriptional regulator with XRE-family HTH domain